MVKKKTEKKQGLVPELRFPEFRGDGEWNPLNGDNVFAQINDRNHNGDLPILAITQEYGAIPRDLIDYNVSVSPTSVKNYKIVRVGDFIISLRSFQGGIEFSDYEGLCSPAYVVLREKGETVAEFFKHFFKSKAFIRELTKNLEGLRDGKMISFTQFSDVLINLPSKAEQQKIADCLGSLDDLIAAHSRKLAALQDHKKGLLQQLFPAEGPTTPKLRFAGFKGEWEETTLGEIVSFQSGGTPSKADSKLWDGAVPWVSARDMKSLFLQDTTFHVSQSAIQYGAKLAQAGTVLMLIRGMTLFKDLPICVLRRPMSFNQDVKALRSKGGLDQDFLPFLLLGNKRRLLELVDAAGHGTGRLNMEGLKSLLIAYPQRNEQQKIVDCLSALDAFITAQTEQIATLKAHKKALMQQLFPNPEQVMTTKTRGVVIQ